MKIEERVAPNSREHWVLFALRSFEKHREEGASATDLYKATGEKFPDDGWVREGLDELSRRNLIQMEGGLYVTHNNGRVALDRRGKPEDPPWVEPEPPKLDEQDEAEEEEDDEEEDDEYMGEYFPDKPWHPTEHSGIYFGSEGDTFKGEGVGVGTAKKVREVLPEDYDVVITVGPYRFYDVAYAVDTKHRRVRLDYYSVRPDTGKWQDNIVRAVHREALEEMKWEADDE